MADAPVDDPNKIIDEIESSPYVPGGGITGLGKKPPSKKSPDYTSGPAKTVSNGAVKGIGASKTALGGISGITGMASKGMEGFRKLEQAVTHPSVTGNTEMNTFADMTKLMTDTTQEGIKGINDWNNKRKTDKINMAKMKANDATFLRELEVHREKALDRLENTDFRDKNAVIKEIDKEFMDRFKAQGLDPKNLDRNSDVAQWYTRFVGELNSIMNGEKRERNDQRRIEAANQKMWKDKSRLDVKDAEKKSRTSRIKNMKMVKKLAGSRSNTYSWAMGRAIANIDKNGDIDPTSADDLAKYSDKILKELQRMSVTDVKNQNKYLAAFDTFQTQVNQHRYMMDRVSKDFLDKTTLDLNTPIDEVLVNSGSIVKKDNYGVPTEGVNSYVAVANKRMDKIVEEMMRLDMRPRNPDGSFADPDDEKKYLELKNQYSRIKTDQDLGVLGRLQESIGSGLNDLLWTTNGNLLDERDMNSLQEGFVNSMGALIPQAKNMYKRGKGQAFVYQLADPAISSYIQSYAKLQFDKAADILNRASNLSIALSPKDMDEAQFLHKKNPLDARSGLNLTLQDLIENGIIKETDPFIYPHIADGDGGFVENAGEILANTTLADVLTRNIYREFKDVSAEAGRIFKENGMPVGESEHETLRRTNSLVTGIAKALGVPMDAPINNGPAGSPGNDKPIEIKNKFGYKEAYKVGKTPINVDENGFLVFDPATVSPMIGGSNFASILNTPDAYDTPFQAMCAMLGFCKKDLDGVPAIEAGKVIEPKLLGKIRHETSHYNDLIKQSLSGRSDIENIPEIEEIIFGDDLNEMYKTMDVLAGRGSGGRRSDFIDEEFGGVFGGKMDGMVMEKGDKPGDGHIVDAKAVKMDDMKDWGIKIDANGKADLSNVKVPEKYKLQIALYNHYLPTPKDHAWIAVTFKGPKDNETLGENWSGNDKNTFMLYVKLDDEETKKEMTKAYDWFEKMMKSGKGVMPQTPEDFALYNELIKRRT